ncbi:hypothetical protein RBH20_09750 [Haloarcula sp. H-GB4]|uniref:hypothetical protein n=1 Tax=Haloarcula sp. H-GB4 TaxID=3069755 RepID=UPI0027B07BDC|nr:hypothetical protein [Haloarcula sp. H-GB4]MDQ2072817.1 hypothetical protein [Haloarcula sp. H-GB4]
MPRPGSRESAAVRRALSRRWGDSAKTAESVYGDSDIVTVVYDLGRPMSGTAHAECLGGVAHALAALASKGTAPRLLRGVCHLPDEPIPLVWLLRREWACAEQTGEMDDVDLLGRVAATSPLFGDVVDTKPRHGVL